MYISSAGTPACANGQKDRLLDASVGSFHFVETDRSEEPHTLVRDRFASFLLLHILNTLQGHLVFIFRNARRY